jgi:hypothetical protein
MVKASLAVMVTLTVVIAYALRWREGRMAAQARGAPSRPVVLGWVARQKAAANRWVTAAAIAAIGTTVVIGGLHWLKVASQ